jgi:hypothetical protein
MNTSLSISYKQLPIIVILFLAFNLSVVQADLVQARCDIYPKGEDHTDISIPCEFTQRQGYISIKRSDNIFHNLSPQDDVVGNFKDQHGDYVYRQSGLGKDGVIFLFKKESIYLYWDITRQPLATSYKPKPKVIQAFDKSFNLLGIGFQLISSNNGSINTLQLTPSGLEIDNSVIEKEIDGTVTNAEIADLNGDGSPEIYIYINSAGSGSYGDVIAYSANNKKSLSPIYLPSLMDDKANSHGYMGHDEFTVRENCLARRFPVYKSGDKNSKPTGGFRQLQYQLVSGEASWQLQLVSSVWNSKTTLK